MKKTLVGMFLASAVMLSFTGCNKKEKIYTVDELVKNPELLKKISDQCDDMSLTQVMNSVNCAHQQKAWERPDRVKGENE